MNIQELLEIAKEIKVTEEQLCNLKVRLQENYEKYTTTEFLERTYGI